MALLCQAGGTNNKQLELRRLLHFYHPAGYRMPESQIFSMQIKPFSPLSIQLVADNRGIQPKGMSGMDTQLMGTPGLREKQDTGSMRLAG